MTTPKCTCNGASFMGTPIHWDDCPTLGEPSGVVAISPEAAGNIQAFERKYGREPRGAVETMAAMLHGAKAEAGNSGTDK